MQSLPIDLRLLEEHAAAAAQLEALAETQRLQMCEWALKGARRKQAAGQADTTVHFVRQGGRLVAISLDMYNDDDAGTPMVCLPHPTWGKCQPHEGEEWTVVGAGQTMDGLVWILPVFNSRWN
ncbi:MAG: hypothetical protein RI947_424 [Candidatus Parcubacteria bacterium]|jgi:hypothetical protein